jgi:hypothetical protein
MEDKILYKIPLKIRYHFLGRDNYISNFFIYLEADKSIALAEFYLKLEEKKQEIEKRLGIKIIGVEHFPAVEKTDRILIDQKRIFSL